MKKAIFSVMAVMLSCMTAFAQLTDGFYRVQNYGSSRYLYVRDCTGNVSTLGADMGSIELWPNLEEAISDPGSVIYIHKVGSAYDLTSQATGVHEMTDRYMSISMAGEYCMVYNSGQYLYETGTSDFYPDMGILGAKTTKEMPGKTNYRLWKTYPISSNSDNYFGFKPTVKAEGKLYAPFYADFAYTPVNKVKTWYVSQVDQKHGIAVIKQIEGTVARSQATIIECPSASPSENRVDLKTEKGNAAADNKLTGTYFSNADRSGISHTGKNPAIITFDPKTMRVLGTNEEGKLAFINKSDALPAYTVKINGKWTPDTKCIPHNQSYLTVDAECPATLLVMTESEYEKYLASLVTVVGEAKMATNISISESQSELGYDIPASGGRDRAWAKVDYSIVNRTFLSNGTYQDSIISENASKVIYGTYTDTMTSLDTLQQSRTLINTSTPEGTLTDANGEVVFSLTDNINQLTACKIKANELKIYQQANNIESYSEVNLKLGKEVVELTNDAQTLPLSPLVEAEQTVTYTSTAKRAGEITIIFETAQAADGISIEDEMIVTTENIGSAVRQMIVNVIAQGEGGKKSQESILVQQAINTGIAQMPDTAEKMVIYDLQGNIYQGSWQSLPRGIYIINNKKYIKK